MYMKTSYFLLLFMIIALTYCGSSDSTAGKKRAGINKIKLPTNTNNKVIVAAERTKEYVHLLKNKNIAIVGNQSSLINKTHLVDSLMSLGINIKKIFCPEHGFRGETGAGEHIGNYIDTKTGLKVISLYGKSKKPKQKDLEDIDIVVFDIQDVGVRFFTYIGTLHYVMEACAEAGLPLLILDRPNPNGYYVDGNILDTAFKSFIGMHAVPIVHGMTIGEYAYMINGEGWLKNRIKCEINVITCKNYDHTISDYKLPVKPSPNLPNQKAVKLYPSICFFEGTCLSIGRGTDMQFQVIGHPKLKEKGDSSFLFTPVPNQGAKHPKLENQVCYGFDLRKDYAIFENPENSINLNYILYLYKIFPDKELFFLNNRTFELLAGNNILKQQIIEGKTAKQIKDSWQPGLNKFKLIRKKYLLYKDFE